jgi:hypothetical protein
VGSKNDVALRSSTAAQSRRSHFRPGSTTPCREREKKAREVRREERRQGKAAAPDLIAEELANEEGRHRDTKQELEARRALLGQHRQWRNAAAELRADVGGVRSYGSPFDGDFAPHSQTYAGAGTIRYTW